MTNVISNLPISFVDLLNLNFAGKWSANWKIHKERRNRENWNNRWGVNAPWNEPRILEPPKMQKEKRTEKRKIHEQEDRFGEKFVKQNTKDDRSCDKKLGWKRKGNGNNIVFLPVSFVCSFYTRVTKNLLIDILNAAGHNARHYQTFPSRTFD